MKDRMVMKFAKIIKFDIKLTEWLKIFVHFKHELVKDGETVKAVGCCRLVCSIDVVSFCNLVATCVVE